MGEKLLATNDYPYVKCYVNGCIQLINHIGLVTWQDMEQGGGGGAHSSVSDGYRIKIVRY